VQADEPVVTRLKWLLVFRGLVVSVLLVSSVLVRASTEEALFARAALALYVVAGAAYGSILLGALVLRARSSLATAVAYSQLIADAMIASALVWLTGGAESVFVFIYSLSVLNAAIVLGRRAALVLAGISALMYAGVAWVASPTVSLPVLVPSVLTNGSSFLLVAVLSGYLTSQLTRTSARLQDARDQIVKLEGLYASVLGSLPSGVMSVGAKGDVVFTNAAAQDILGLGNRDPVGRSAVELANVLPSLLSHVDNARFEVEVDIGGRGRRVLGGSVAPLLGGDDPGRVLVFQDLTELRRLQEDMARTERLAELGRLAAGLAHEIRNPLAAMIGCLQLLAADTRSASGDNARLLGIVQREAERLSGMVLAFLTYARPAEPTTRRVAVRQLLEEAVAAARYGLRSSTIEFVPCPDVWIAVDSDQMRQVLWNVITNADIVGASLGRSLRITVGAEVEGETVNLVVDDDGPGVPEELRQRIFEPFFTTRPDGNGLGLATSHQLVSRNTGVMGAQRSPTLGGARFSIRLPLDVASSTV
jgi:two-component system sensor histidine kinase PilS (NtrC family)